MPIDPRLCCIWDGIRGPGRRVFPGDLTPAEAVRFSQKDAGKRPAEGLP